MRNKGGQQVAVVSFEYGTLAIKVCSFFNFAVVFLQRISISAKFKQNLRQLPYH